MMKKKNGTARQDIIDKLFDRELWIRQKPDKLKIQIKDIPILGFKK